MRSKFADLIEAIRVGLNKQNEIEFSAPWAPRVAVAKPRR